MEPSVIVIGGPTQDVFLTGPALDAGADSTSLCLPLGAKLDCRAITTVGGNVANVAVTLARAGLKPRFIGRTGDDPAGRAGRNQLRANRVNVDELKLIVDQPSAYSIVLLAGDGERTILTDHGVELDPADWQPALASLNPGDWVYLSSVGRPKRLAELIRTAAGRGAQIALNPSSKDLQAAGSLLAVADRLRLLIANRDEMRQLWPGQRSDELAAAAGEQIPTVVVTDGPRGSVVADKGQLYRAGLWQPETTVVDRTGAGDAFAGGFLAGLILNQPLETCLTWAAANSTAVIGQIGTQAGILALGQQPLEPVEVSRIKIDQEVVFD